MRSWLNTILLTAILCIVIFFYSHHNPPTNKTPSNPSTPTTIQFNVPQNQAHEYEQEGE